MSDKSFEFKEESSQNSVKLILIGYLNENAILPEVKKSSNLTINLSNVKYLNSVGTRAWCIWIKKIPLTTNVILEECPMLFVNAFNYVSGFLPKNATVNSFHVPYISQDTEESKLVLYKRGEHYDGLGRVSHRSVIDSKGKPMELDVLNNYFSFLKK